jgi:flagellar biosynthetic protein FliO
MKFLKRHIKIMESAGRLLKRRRTLVGLGVLASLFVILALVSSAATGQAGKPPVLQSDQAPAEVPDAGIGGMTLKVVGTVVLLIVVLYAGMYVMRVLSGRTGKGGFDSGAISVLHKSHIAPKKAIYVIRIGDRAMVVGVTDSQINHLADLSQEELSSLKTTERPRGQSFKQQLLGFALGVKERP